MIKKGKKIKVDTIEGRIELLKSTNYWSENPDGKRYLDSLVNSGRVREAGLLADRYLPQRKTLTSDWELGKTTPEVARREKRIPRVLYQKPTGGPRRAVETEEAVAKKIPKDLT